MSKEGEQTPVKKERRRASIKELYEKSIKRQIRYPKKCLLCLLCSSDCDNTRCSNPNHVTCLECTYEWNLDKQCPICRNDTYSTQRKRKRTYKYSDNLSFEDGDRSSRFYESPIGLLCPQLEEEKSQQQQENS